VRHISNWNNTSSLQHCTFNFCAASLHPMRKTGGGLLMMRRHNGDQCSQSSLMGLNIHWCTTPMDIYHTNVR
jgi:hypothetical protein